MHEGKVVLVRHTYMDGWHFPGGSLNRWETPLEAAAREAREETGAELLAPPEFLGLFSSYGRGKSDHVAFYLCRHFRLGRALDRWEIAECRHFALDELPPQLNDQSRKVLRDFALRKQ
jgi:ADP-ribose pyrophosphatase YjhB (NUDIX family)